MSKERFSKLRDEFQAAYAAYGHLHFGIHLRPSWQWKNLIEEGTNEKSQQVGNAVLIRGPHTNGEHAFTFSAKVGRGLFGTADVPPQCMESFMRLAAEAGATVPLEIRNQFWNCGAFIVKTPLEIWLALLWIITKRDESLCHEFSPGELDPRPDGSDNDELGQWLGVAADHESGFHWYWDSPFDACIAVIDRCGLATGSPSLLADSAYVDATTIEQDADHTNDNGHHKGNGANRISKYLDVDETPPATNPDVPAEFREHGKLIGRPLTTTVVTALVGLDKANIGRNAIFATRQSFPSTGKNKLCKWTEVVAYARTKGIDLESP